MLINKTDIGVCKARLLSRTILPASKTIEYEYLSNRAIIPMKTAETEYRFKSMNLVFTIDAQNEEELELLKGKLTQLLSHSEIRFDDIHDIIYECYLSGDTDWERITNTKGNLSVKLNARAYGEEIIQNISDSQEILVSGDLETPCIIEISPDIGIQSLQIDGIARDRITNKNEPVLINHLTKNKKIIVNGENCTVIEEGNNKFKDCTMWSFPSLVPGKNEITLSSSCNIKIRYKPRYI